MEHRHEKARLLANVCDEKKIDLLFPVQRILRLYKFRNFKQPRAPCSKFLNATLPIEFYESQTDVSENEIEYFGNFHS